MEDNLDPPNTANWLFFPGATVKVEYISLLVDLIILLSKCHVWKNDLKVLLVKFFKRSFSYLIFLFLFRLCFGKVVTSCMC